MSQDMIHFELLGGLGCSQLSAGTINVLLAGNSLVKYYEFGQLELNYFGTISNFLP